MALCAEFGKIDARSGCRNASAPWFSILTMHGPQVFPQVFPGVARDEDVRLVFDRRGRRQTHDPGNHRVPELLRLAESLGIVRQPNLVCAANLSSTTTAIASAIPSE